MRTVAIAGRLCITRPILRSSRPLSTRCLYQNPWLPPSCLSRGVHQGRWQYNKHSGQPWWTFARARKPVTVLLAALSPAAFLSLAEDNNDPNATGESEMLAASRQELKKRIPEDANIIVKICQRIYLLLDKYVFEVVATGLRFAHLVVIFVPVLVTFPAIWLGPKVKDRDHERAGALLWYRFLVFSMERAGPAFIKLAQWAASRTDLFPPELCSLMSSLHSHAPAHPLSVTKRTISKAFNGLNFEDIFEEFNEEPLGVGAIAQVYKAKLRSDLAAPNHSELLQEPRDLRARVRKNVDVLVKSAPQRVPSTYVAIKVQHPRVERIVRRDLRIMMFFAKLINAIPTMEWLSFPDEVRNFADMMHLQLDLRIEAANLALFREHFKSRTTAWFPYPYTEYTTREVLVEEFARGIPLDVFLVTGGGVFQQAIAREGLDAFLHMLLIDNFVHADLHPGNIMVRFCKPGQLDLSLYGSQLNQAYKGSQGDALESVLDRLRVCQHDPERWESTLAQLDTEGYRPQLIFVDTGLVTELNSVNRSNFLDLFRAIAEFDGYRAGHLMVERSRQPDAVLDAEIFALKMQHLVLSVKGRTFALGNVSVGDVLNQVLSMVRTHHVRLEGDFVNVVISILLLEGIGRALDPNLDLFKSALPILRRLGSSTTMIKSMRAGDMSMLRVWVGLEARSFLKASVESVEWCVKYDRLSPNL